MTTRYYYLICCLFKNSLESLPKCLALASARYVGTRAPGMDGVTENLPAVSQT